jgi:hypothetical protein
MLQQCMKRKRSHMQGTKKSMPKGVSNTCQYLTQV